MFNQASPTHHSFDAGDIVPFKLDQHYAMDDISRLLPMIGVGFNPGVLNDMRAAYVRAQSHGMDSIQNLNTTTAAIPNLVQFLQTWLPGIVEQNTAARTIDNIIGVSTVGAWEDEQIIQQVMELTGTPTPYFDQTNVPLTSWNLNFVPRTVVRFELGMKVGKLEELRSSRVRVNSADQKRKSANLQLEIQRNALGFYGYNSGNNLTYGFLTDPNLPNYQTVANPGSGTTWAVKTALQMQADLLTAIQSLRTASQDTIDPEKTPMTLTVATAVRDYLSKTSDFFTESVIEWLAKNYPNIRVVSSPQLNAANGGANVFYLHADSVNDGASTDDQRTFIQVVPARFQLVGVAMLAKGYEEDYSNASAGVMCKRPYAVQRWSGV